MWVARSFITSVLVAAAVSTPAQTAPAASGCAVPEVRATFDTTLSQDSLARLKTKDRNALLKRVLDGLLAKYPREYSLYEHELEMLQGSSQQDTKTASDALRDRWLKDAKEHPDDGFALLLAGKVLINKDTAEAIRLLETARQKAPDLPWPAHELSVLYWQGKYADSAKMKENLERFYSLCPTWTPPTYFLNQIESIRLQKDLPLVSKTAVALRAALEKETDPQRLKDYQILWQREFLTRPPVEHDLERAQVRQDLKRLEMLVPNGDVAWRSFLIQGYSLSGASTEEMTRLREAAAHDFPDGGPAAGLLFETWDKHHPRPDGQKDAEAWKAYYASDVAMTKKTIHDFPNDMFAQRCRLYMVAREDEFISREDGLEALDRYLQAQEEYGGFGTLSFAPSDPPKFLLDHGWQPERALELLKKTSTYKDGGHTRTQWSDNLAEADVKRFQRFAARDDRSTLGLILRAAAMLGKPEEALRFRAAIEEPPPDDKDSLEQYWTNRARFAVLDKHPQDALLYYRLAVDSRTHAPEYHHGILRDDLLTEFHKLWTAQGGSEAAWAAWNPPSPLASKGGADKKNAAAENGSDTKQKQSPASEKNKVATGKKTEQESEWKPITEKMPSFELSDFYGKTWRQSDLRGKVVVILSWATWCAPCGLQDKLLERLYEKHKNRKDLVILTFNVDENLGKVLPSMRRNKYTFPVMAAYSFEKAKGLVPRIWIIDPRGNWRWVKDGYDETKTYAEFENDMLDRIEKARAE